MKLPEITPINFSANKPESLHDRSDFNYKTSSVVPRKNMDISVHEPYGSIPEKTESWDIAKLENFFKNTPLPSAPVKLNPWTAIIDISLFITSHLEVIKLNNGIKNYEPYYTRLIELKNYLSSNLN